MMPALPMPAEIRPGQFGPIRRIGWPSVARRFTNVSAFIMSIVGMPSVIATISGMPASAASMIASAANGGGTKITVAFARVFSTACAHRIEHRPAFVRRPALARRGAADDVRAVGRGLLRVERAFAAGQPLHEQARLIRDQNCHK